MLKFLLALLIISEVAMALNICDFNDCLEMTKKLADNPHIQQQSDADAENRHVWSNGESENHYYGRYGSSRRRMPDHPAHRHHHERLERYHGHPLFPGIPGGRHPPQHRCPKCPRCPKPEIREVEREVIREVERERDADELFLLDTISQLHLFFDDEDTSKDLCQFIAKRCRRLQPSEEREEENKTDYMSMIKCRKISSEGADQFRDSYCSACDKLPKFEPVGTSRDDCYHDCSFIATSVQIDIKQSCTQLGYQEFAISDLQECFARGKDTLDQTIAAYNQ
ncbi:hypothetical protein PCE1_001346 [Barthelona sp. PCE]